MQVLKITLLLFAPPVDSFVHKLPVGAITPVALFRRCAVSQQNVSTPKKARYCRLLFGCASRLDSVPAVPARGSVAAALAAHGHGAGISLMSRSSLRP